MEIREKKFNESIFLKIIENIVSSMFEYRLNGIFIETDWTRAHLDCRDRR